MQNSSLTFLDRGKPSRLIPSVSDSSKEGRAISILLYCLENVHEFGKEMLSLCGAKLNSRTRIETFTEVVFKKGHNKALRPDGLVVLRNGNEIWTAMIEGKIGSNDLSPDQIESYLELARLNNIDCLITISNQVAPLPSHYPIRINPAAAKKASLFHWSWSQIHTASKLLVANNAVSDRMQADLLNELYLFLDASSSGVQNFDQMPTEWSEMAAFVQAGGTPSARDKRVEIIVDAWHKEMQDLCFMLTRKFDKRARVKVSRAHSADITERIRHDSAKISESMTMASTLTVEGVVADITVVADFRKRAVFVGMCLPTPDTKKTTKGKVSWLLRQLSTAKTENVHLKLIWPGRTQQSLHPFAQIDENFEFPDFKAKAPTHFELFYLRDLGSKFAQRRAVISELEFAVSLFLDEIGCRLKEPPKSSGPKYNEKSKISHPISSNVGITMRDSKIAAFRCGPLLLLQGIEDQRITTILTPGRETSSSSLHFHTAHDYAIDKTLAGPVAQQDRAPDS